MANHTETVGVNLAFTADTGQARRELQSLQSQLNDLLKAPDNTNFMDKAFQDASKDIAKLKVSLEDAINPDTQKLDLGKFNESLKSSGMTLSKYQKTFSSLGADGQKAFHTLTNSILKAEMPLKRSNETLNKFFSTLKTTARWQISNAALNAFYKSIEGAYNYAKQLNKSLNNIRIVTGQSSDEMATFAKEANAAAQSLSTTTKAYTDASLIYYQQGLSDKEVKERTEVTMKMANVSRQSAEEVSQQMTAVWNNFNKNSDRSAEHFADVMTKLGAETASSTSEIAEGLQKFAAISDTVGLSFDYASSALATITATSRESADVVGTSLKTIFGRIEGLKLGKSLEDGTDLNKYSEGLQKIGVNIKDASGSLKDMDTILDELGARWQDLTEAQKIATAQTVGGVRQYAQFMNLMENWDFMQENVSRAKSAEGTLQKQQDTYAEGWEASAYRVQAALEKLWQNVLDDDFFIGMTNGLEKVINYVDKLIQSFGGLGGVFATASSIFLRKFQPQIGKGIDDIVYNFKMHTKKGKKELEDLRQEASDKFAENITGNKDSEETRRLSSMMTKYKQLQDEYLKNADKMTEAEKKQYQILLDQYDVKIQLGIEQAKQLQELKKAEEQEINRQARKLAGKDASKEKVDEIKNALGKVNKAEKQAAQGRYDANKYYQEDMIGHYSGATKKELVDLYGEETGKAVHEVMKAHEEKLKEITEKHEKELEKIDKDSTKTEEEKKKEKEEKNKNFEDEKEKAKEETITNLQNTLEDDHGQTDKAKREAAQVLKNNGIQDGFTEEITELTDEQKREIEHEKKFVEMTEKQIEAKEKRIEQLQEIDEDNQKKIDELNKVKTENIDKEKVIEEEKTRQLDEIDKKNKEKYKQELLDEYEAKRNEGVYTKNTIEGLSDSTNSLFAEVTSKGLIKNALFGKLSEKDIDQLKELGIYEKYLKAEEKGEFAKYRGVGARYTQDYMQTSGINMKMSEEEQNKKRRENLKDINGAIVNNGVRSGLAYIESEEGQEEIKNRVEADSKRQAIITKYEEKIEKLNNEKEKIEIDIDNLSEEAREARKKEIENLEKEKEALKQKKEEYEKKAEEAKQRAEEENSTPVLDDDVVENVTGNVENVVEQTNEANDNQKRLENADLPEQSEKGGAGTGEKITALASGLTDVFSIMETGSGILETLGDDSQNAFEKLSTVGPAIATMGGNAFETFSNLKETLNLTTKQAGLLGGALVAVAAGIAIISKAIKDSSKLNEDYSEAGMLKGIQEVSDRLNESLTETKQRIDDIKGSISTYKSLREEIEGCKVGTAEWNEKIRESNQQVLDLLEKYPELREKENIYYKDSEGRYRLNEKEYNNFLEEQQEQQEQQQKSLRKNNIAIERGSKIASNKQQIFQGSSLPYENLSVYSSPVTLAIEGVQEINGTHQLELEQYQNVVYKNLEDITKIVQDHLDKVGGDYDKLAESTEGINKELLEKYGVPVSVLGENLKTFVDNANNVLTDEKFRNPSQESKDYIDDVVKSSGKDYNDAVKNAAAKNYEDRLAAYTEKYTADYGHMDIGEIAQQYSWENDKAGILIDSVTEDKETGIITYRNTEGEQKSFKREDIVASKAQKAAETVTNNELDTMQEKNEKASAGVQGNENIKTFLQYLDTGDIAKAVSSLTFADIQELKRYKTQTSKETGRPLLEDFLGGSEKVEDYLGVKDASIEEKLSAKRDYYDKIINAIDERNKISISSTVAENVNEATTNQTKVGTSDNIKNIFQEVFSHGGSEALDVVKDSFVKSTEEDKEKLAQVYSEAINNDYSLEDLKKRLKEVGLEGKYSEKELKGLINSFKELDTISAEMVQNYNGLKSVEEAVKNNQNITSEQMEQLRKAGVDADKYFSEMADGTYALTSSAQGFLQIAKEAEKSQFRDTRDTLAGKVKSIDEGVIAAKSSGTKEVTDDSLQKQINALRAIDYDSEKITEWENKLKEGSLETDKKAIEELTSAIEASGDAFQKMKQDLIEVDTQLASTAKDTEELDEMLKKGEISSQAYLNAFKVLDRKQDLEGINMQELEDYQDYLEDIAGSTKELSKDLGKHHASSEAVAKSIMKMNTGVKTLSKNWKNWSSILKKSSKYSEEYARAFMGTRGALAKLLDIDKSAIKLNFVTKNLDLIKKASKGSGDAIDELKNRLHEAFKKDYFKDFKDRKARLKLDVNEKEVKKQMKNIEKTLKGLKGKENKIGFKIDKENKKEFLKDANEMVKKAGMSASEAQKYFDSLGYEMHWTKETVPQYGTYTETETSIEPIDDEHAGSNPNEGSGIKTYGDNGQLLHYKTVTKPIKTKKIKLGEQDVMATKAGKGTPKITGLTKKPSGSANDFSSSNSGGGSPSGKSKRGSGGSKTGKKALYNPDPYIKINRLISDNTHKIDLNNKALEKHNYLIEHSFGAEKANYLKQSNIYLDKENRLLNKNIEYQKKKNKIGKRELQKDIEILRKAGAKIDKNGNFVSARAENAFRKKYNEDAKEDISTAYADDSNDAKKIKNKKKKNKAEKEAQKKRDKATLAVRKIQNALSNRDREKEAIQSSSDAIVDDMNKKLENKLAKLTNNKEAWQLVIEAKIEDKELKKSWNDFLANVAKNTRKIFIDTKKQVDYVRKSFNLTKKEFNISGNALKELKEDYNDVFFYSDSNKFLTTSEAAQEIVNKYQDAQKYAENLLNLTNEAWNNYDTEVNNVLSYFDKINNKFSELTNLLDYDLKIIDLFYDKDSEAYRKANKIILQGQKDISQNQVSQYEKQNSILQKMKEIDWNTLSKEDKKIWTDMGYTYEQYVNMSKNEEAITNKIKENNIAIQNETVKILETIEKIYKINNEEAMSNARENIASLFSMSDYQDFEGQRKEWDYYLKDSQAYYDNVEKSYQIMTLANQVMEDKNKSTNLAVQQKLQGYYDREIKYLKERKNLTETDVRLAKERYDILLKQIALEEAQKSKDSMKMVRDTNGNWTYQYVADADAVNKAREDKEKSVYDYYEDTKKSTEEAKNQLYSDYEEMEKELNEIAEIKDEKERDKKLKQAQAYWAEKLEKDAENLANKQGLFANASTAALQMFGEDFLTDEEKEIVELYKKSGYGEGDTYESLFYDLINNAENDEERNRLISLIYGQNSLLSKAFTAFQEGNVKINIEELIRTIMANGTKRNQEMEKIENPERVASDVATSVNASENLDTSVDIQKLTDLSNTAKDLDSQLQEVIKTLEDYQDIMEEASLFLRSEKQRKKYTFDGENYYSYSVKQKNNTGEEIVLYYVKDEEGRLVVQPTEDREKIKEWKAKQKEKKNNTSSESKNKVASGATGMYTGDWSGDIGKLAILHKKELVLNEDDTKNMLRMVEIARNSAKMQDFYNNALTSMNLKYPSLAKNKTEKCGDVYNVTAEFPNANDVTTIKNAILSLPNIVTQQVHERTIL